MKMRSGGLFLTFVSYGCIIAAPVMAPLYALAQEGISDSTDIMGLNLNMSPEQAKNSIASNFPAAKSTKLVAKVGTEYFKQEVPVGYYSEIEPAGAFDPRRGVSNKQGEFVNVIYGPNASDLLGIVHYNGYKAGSMPTKETVIQSLTEKYGKPLSFGNSLVGQLVWSARANVRAIPAGGLQYIDYPSPGACHFPAVGANVTSFLYADAGLFGGNGMATFSSGEEIASNTSSKFVSVLDTVLNDNKYFAKCGVLLGVELGYPNNNPDYVSSITQRIVDFDRANAELVGFGEDFSRKADQAKQGQLGKDSANKPKL